MKQADLFPPAEKEKSTTQKVPGFRLEAEYLDQKEEAHLLHRIDQQPWLTDFRRRVQRYGYGYGTPGHRKGQWVKDFPDWLKTLAARVGRDASFDKEPDNCVINEYIPPQGIGSHKDYSDFGPIVACVSLGSGTLFEFKPPANKEKVSVFVPSRSFWVISGEARSAWEHGIPARLSDIINGEKILRSRRVSITFRTAL